MSNEEYITKTGKVLGDDELEALSKEAEMGYARIEGSWRSIEKVLLASTDGRVWAHHFKAQFKDWCPDEHTVMTWFSNAIEVGRQTGYAQGYWDRSEGA